MKTKNLLHTQVALAPVICASSYGQTKFLLRPGIGIASERWSVSTDRDGTYGKGATVTLLGTVKSNMGNHSPKSARQNRAADVAGHARSTFSFKWRSGQPKSGLSSQTRRQGMIQTSLLIIDEY